MAFMLTHLKCVEPGPGAESRLLSELSSASQARFAQFAVCLPERRIDWNQSFALKGLPFDAYILVGREAGHRWSFLRRVEADPALPDKVTLAQTGDPEATRQGDVLTYVVSEVFVHFREVCCLLYPPGHRVPPDLLKAGWIETLADLTRVQSLCGSETENLFCRAFIEGWEPECSLIQVL